MTKPIIDRTDKLVNVYYQGEYEATTDNFEKWVKYHNDERGAYSEEELAAMSEEERQENEDEGNLYETEEEFTTKECNLVLFEKVKYENA
tara:strand:+ start:768 stop:1037 length:270 start_codon:yes stop_codon:yes gene_type:complete